MSGLPGTCPGMEVTSMSVSAVTDQSFEAEVLASRVPVLLDFTTAWCPPCRALAPVLHRLAEENAGRPAGRPVDGDDQPALAGRLRIKASPTVVAFAGGEEVGRHGGLTTGEKLLRLVAG